MEEWTVPWSGRGHNYTAEEVEAVVEAMQKADPQTQGNYQSNFESKFSKKYGLNSAFAVTSCAAALELSAILSRIQPGDEVICPAHTFAVSAIPFARRGAKIRWADIDAKSFVVSAKEIAPLITAKTKVIVVVHLYGLVCDMGPIMELARAHNILVVEDAAQSIGAQYQGQYSGAIGDFGCFSFHGHKNMTTLGEGGVLAVKDPALAAVTPGFRHNGMRGFTEAREHYWKPAMGNVDFDWENQWPFNFCMGEVQAALGAKLVDRVEAMNHDRMRRAKRFRQELSEFSELVFQEIPEDTRSSYHLLAAHYEGPKGRDELMKLLAYEYKIKCVVQYYPLYRYPIFKRAGFEAHHCPNTDKFFDNMISFPFHHHMSEKQFEYMLDKTKQSLLALRK